MHSIKNIRIVVVFFVLLSIGCTKDGSNLEDSSGSGTGGSLARFTISANHLYLADYNEIHVYDLANEADPIKKNSVNVGFGVETIYPYKDKLFIGSRDGMYIFSIADPSNPVKLGEARHVRSCDPVVANDTVAYVTLQGNSACGPAQDGLYVYDIKDITKPVQTSLFPISTPFGLGLKDSVVFVCRGGSGLSLVNVKNPRSPKLMYTITEGNFMDVIPYDNLLICYVSTGLLLYDISNLEQIVKVGEVDY